jgi:hydroxyacylglutathione hydrolase
MLIHAVPAGPYATNAYVIACPTTREAAIIDPAPRSAARIATYLKEEKLVPKKILLTHSHWDHIADADELMQEFDIPLYVHRADAPNVRHPGNDGLPLAFPIIGVEPTGYLVDGEEIPLGHLMLRVIHTPGHSPGGVCLYEPKAGILLSGDTLFKGTIGNLSFPTCDAEAMWRSLDTLAKLPPKTRIYPGHGPTTTIGDESWLPQARQRFG